MFKYLPPANGLHHLGEQCGMDLYMNYDNHQGDVYLEVNIFDFFDYEIGIFQGKSLKFANNWLKKHKNSEKNK